MLLEIISIHNYRCFASIADLPLEPITAFIGPNDSGKSSMLLLLHHCFHNKSIPEADFGDKNQSVTVELHFRVIRAHEAEKAQPFMWSSNELWIKKEFQPDKKPATWVYRECYDDNRLNQLSSLQMAELNDLVQELAIEPRPRLKADCVQAVRGYIAQHSPAAHLDWVPGDAELEQVLPEYLTFGADEDLTLQSGPLIATLREVYRRFLQEEEPAEVSQLLGRAKLKLEDVVSQIKPDIARFAGDGAELVIAPTLELANSLNLGEVLVRMSTGESLPFSRCGDGTKRRIMLGLFHWSNGILSKILEEEQRSILWGFDEPDTHLHYQAQHELLSTIKRLAEDRMQVLLCTHSIPIIDRLAPTAIRQMLPDRSLHATNVEYLRVDDIGADDAATVEQFLAEVGQGIGFSNSLLFYERCFILVEGPTEEKALPVLYHALHQVEPIEHGIRIFAAESDTAVLALARLLHRNSKEVVILLDRDTEGKHTSLLDKLRANGFNVPERIVYIGTAEFEDAFCNEALLLCLNAHYPRHDGGLWTKEHIDSFRYSKEDQENRKFSRDFLEVHVGQVARKTVKKPTFGRQLAEQLTDERLIPGEIKDLFTVVQKIAKIR